MPASKKVWVIGVDDLRERVRSGATRGGTSSEAEKLQVHVGSVPDRTGLLLVTAYVLGPLAPVVMRQGKGSVLWAILGLAGLPLWGLHVWRWSEISAWLANGVIPFLPWLLGMLVLTVLGTLAWARAIHLAGSDPRFRPDRLPRWIRGPGLIGYVGLFAPGSGLLLGGAPRRAAMAVANAGVVGVAALLLWKAPMLWKVNLATDAAPISTRTLEAAFLAAFTLGFLGALGWVASVLDGMRVGLQRIGGPRTALGDWMNLLLLVALVSLYIASEPKVVARDVDQYASSLEQRGMQLLPLQLMRVSRRLDPARPAYALHAATLLEASGRPEEAAQVRDELRAGWEEYERILAPPPAALADSLLTGAGVADSLARVRPDALGAAAAKDDSLHAGAADSLASGVAKP